MWADFVIAAIAFIIVAGTFEYAGESALTVTAVVALAVFVFLQFGRWWRRFRNSGARSGTRFVVWSVRPE